MVGLREESHGHNRLGSFKDRPWMTSTLSILSCYHISKIMERMSQLPPLTWSLRPGPKCVAKGLCREAWGCPWWTQVTLRASQAPQWSSLVGNGCRKYPLIQCDRLGEPHGSCVVWVKKYILARLKSIQIVAFSVMSKLFDRRILRRKYRLCWVMVHGTQ